MPQPRRKVGRARFLHFENDEKHRVTICRTHRFDPKENKWSKISYMNTRRLGVAVAVLNGYLYAIGGSDGQSPLNTVERLVDRPAVNPGN